jgi:hypothetical protein
MVIRKHLKRKFDAEQTIDGWSRKLDWVTVLYWLAMHMIMNANRKKSAVFEDIIQIWQKTFSMIGKDCGHMI